MAQQGEGWPMGLQPVSRIRVGFSWNREVSSASASFSALLTSSPTSSDSSSDLDTESTGSFFHDRSITLGRLIGASSVLDFSRGSTRVRNRKPQGTETEKHGKPRTGTCLFSLCLGRDSVSVEEDGNIGIASLGHFLAVERKAAARVLLSPAYSPDEMSIVQAAGQSSNTLFVDGRIAPPLRSQGKTQVNAGISASFCCVGTRPWFFKEQGEWGYHFGAPLWADPDYIVEAQDLGNMDSLVDLSQKEAYESLLS